MACMQYTFENCKLCVYKMKVNLLYLLTKKQRKSVLVYLFKLSHRNTNFKKKTAI